MGLLNDYWQLSDANRDCRVCESYPTKLYILRLATTYIIAKSSRFRSRWRFPALSYNCTIKITSPPSARAARPCPASVPCAWKTSRCSRPSGKPIQEATSFKSLTFSLSLMPWQTMLLGKAVRMKTIIPTSSSSLSG